MRCIRTTSRHRPPALGTGLGPHSAALGAAPSAAVICRWSPPCRAAISASKRSTSRVADPAESGPGARAHPVCLGQPRGIPATAELVDGALQSCVDLQQSLRVGVDDELAPVARRPRRQRLAGDAVEVVDERRTGGDVAGGKEGFAADEQQLGVDRLVGGGKGCAARRLSASRDQLITVEGAAGRGQVAACRSESESTGVLVGSAKLASVAVGGFQMPGDHLVGVERHARSTRFDPVSQPLMEIGAVRLQQPAVCDIANQDVVEAPDRLVAEVRPAGLSKLEPTQSVEGRLDPGRTPFGQRAQGAQREVGADHRGDLQHAPIRGVEPLQTRRQKCMDRGRDGDGVDIDREPPAGRFGDENPVVHEHPDQLAHEQRVAAGR